MASTHRLTKEFEEEYLGLRVLRHHHNPAVKYFHLPFVLVDRAKSLTMRGSVIAVHGLAAHPLKTWQHKNDGWNWLDNQLPELLPRARVWTFGYDSTWCGDRAISVSLHDIASKLLDAIKKEQLSNKSLIFVAHSFGGLLVMKALVMAEDTSNRWSEHCQPLGLFQYTDAILFFGTPFKRIHDWFRFDLLRLAGDIEDHIQDSLFKVLEDKNDVREELRKNFMNKCAQHKRPNILCAWETQLSNVGKILGDRNVEKIFLVPKEDGCLEGGDEGEPRFLGIALERNHFNLHDFHQNDPVFQSVSNLFDKLFADHLATGSARYSLTLTEKECLRSLSFLEMDQRKHDVESPTKATCTWLSNDPDYLQWSKLQKGLLWVIGNPGQGKSTLIKYISEVTRKDEGTLVVSFFFHARGISMQKGFLGLLRSLLHQITRQVPDLLSELTSIYKEQCEIHGEYGKKWEWHENRLRDIFSELVVKAAKSRKVRVFIDALDECDEKSTQPTLGLFRMIASEVGLCVSRRKYPRVSSMDGLEIDIRRYSKRDIAKYLDQQTDINDLFLEEITKRSSGNFLWVRVITAQVRFLKTQQGRSDKFVLEKIKSLPQELSELYKDLFQKIDTNQRPRSLLLMQWVCFAMRPLALDELRVALLLSEGNICRSFRQYLHSNDFVENNEDMEKQVRELSKGLAEVVSRTGHIQLIHQSVWDFLLIQGFELLESSVNRYNTSDFIGRSHLRLWQSCIKCFNLDEVRDLPLYREDHRIYVNPGSKYLFLNYALRYWEIHAEQVERQGLPLTQEYPFFGSDPLVLQVWAKFVHEGEGLWPDTTFLHIASRYNFTHTLNQILDHIPDLDHGDEFGRTPLSYAAEKGHEAIVRLLVDKADPNSVDFYGMTPLSWAISERNTAIMRLLLEGDTVKINLRQILDYHHVHGPMSPWSYSVALGYQEALNLLAARSDLAVNTRDNRGKTPLEDAIDSHYMELVDLLLHRKDINVNYKNPSGETPLQYAIARGSEAALKLLLAHKDIIVATNSKPDYELLSLASNLGCLEIFNLLVANFKARGLELDMEYLEELERHCERSESSSSSSEDGWEPYLSKPKIRRIVDL